MAHHLLLGIPSKEALSIYPLLIWSLSYPPMPVRRPCALPICLHNLWILPISFPTWWLPPPTPPLPPHPTPPPSPPRPYRPPTRYVLVICPSYSSVNIIDIYPIHFNHPNPPLVKTCMGKHTAPSVVGLPLVPLQRPSFWPKCSSSGVRQRKIKRRGVAWRGVALILAGDKW